MNEEIVQPFPPGKQSCDLIRVLGEKIVWKHGSYLYDAVKYRGITYVDKSTKRRM